MEILFQYQFFSQKIYLFTKIFFYIVSSTQFVFFAIRIIITNQVSNIFIFIISLVLSFFFLINKEINAYQLLIIISVFIVFNLLLQKYFTGKNFSNFLFEVSFLKFLKINSLIFFSFIIIFPFYLMFVSSLKSQMVLLQNPTDLSIPFFYSISDFFSSYIAVITQYNFLNFAINSTIVSFVTVFVSLFFFYSRCICSCTLKICRKIKNIIIYFSNIYGSSYSTCNSTLCYIQSAWF